MPPASWGKRHSLAEWRFILEAAKEAGKTAGAVAKKVGCGRASVYKYSCMLKIKLPQEHRSTQKVDRAMMIHMVAGLKWTYQQAADYFGVTRQRIEQLMHKERPGWKPARPVRDLKCVKCGCVFRTMPARSPHIALKGEGQKYCSPKCLKLARLAGSRLGSNLDKIVAWRKRGKPWANIAVDLGMKPQSGPALSTRVKRALRLLGRPTAGIVGNRYYPVFGRDNLQERRA